MSASAPAGRGRRGGVEGQAGAANDGGPDKRPQTVKAVLTWQEKPCQGLTDEVQHAPPRGLVARVVDDLLVVPLVVLADEHRALPDSQKA
jgi:hypothetical protein